MNSPGLAATPHPPSACWGLPRLSRLCEPRFVTSLTFDTLGSALVPTLLLQGETGTGKGLVARVIHDSGPRAAGPFVDVNCAAIPDTMLEAELFGFEPGAFTDARRAKPGLFEAASGGTLFLDEIEALPLALQGKLLTALETKQVRRLGAVTERTGRHEAHRCHQYRSYRRRWRRGAFGLTCITGWPWWSCVAAVRQRGADVRESRAGLCAAV